jgi:uncharacterized protein (TIGR03905 family)
MGKRITYPTCGTCSKFIDVEVDDNNVIQDVVFVGGCHGNLQGIRTLVKGMKAEEVISRVEGIRCGSKPTSCPDQLAKALKKVIE